MPIATMSALTALRGLRLYLAAHPEVSPEAAASSLPAIDSDFACVDVANGLSLHLSLPMTITFDDPSDGFREAIAALIDLNRPWWLRLATIGREKLRVALHELEEQSFRSAGLFEHPPSREVINWWDRVAQKAREEVDLQKLRAGRDAELLSLDYEVARLERLGIDLTPVLVSLDDNSAGYDLRSYDVGLIEPTNRLIEVKSSSRVVPKVFITRNEWESALRFGSSYVFHIWKMPEATLIVRSVSDMAQHIPLDQGRGNWEVAEVPIS